MKDKNDLVTDIAEFYDDPYGFVMYAFPWGEKDTPLEDFPDGPDDWQAEQLVRVGDAIKADPECVIQEAIASGHGVGSTTEAIFIILWAMSTRPHLGGIVTASTLAQLHSKTWPELAVWHKRMINAHWFKWSATKFCHVEYSETWFVVPLPKADKDDENIGHEPEQFAGMCGKNILVIYDCASGIPDIIWDVSAGSMGAGAMWFVYGNPIRNTGRFKECFSDDSRWVAKQIDSRKAKMTNKTMISEWVDEYGEDSDMVRVRIRGVFPRMPEKINQTHHHP